MKPRNEGKKTRLEGYEQREVCNDYPLSKMCSQINKYFFKNVMCHVQLLTTYKMLCVMCDYQPHIRCYA